MRTTFPLVACLALVAAAAPADTVHLSNGGKVLGNLVELKVWIGDDCKTFPRDAIKALRWGARGCTVVTADGEHQGELESVAIRCVAGVLKFQAKTVQSVKLGKAPPPRPPEKSAKPAEPKKPTARPNRPKPPAAPKLSDEQRRKLKALMKTAATLRDQALRDVKALREKEYAAVKDKYLHKYQAACDTVAQKRRELGKHWKDIDTSKPQVRTGGLGVNMSHFSTATRTGAAASAVAALDAAEAKKRQLAAKIRALKRAIALRARLRRDLVLRYYDAIIRNLLTGKEIPEDAMKKAFDKAVHAR